MEKNVERNLIRTKQQYGVISQNILRHPLISSTAKSLYAYLSSFAGFENSAFPSRELVCYEMDINKETLSIYMWELQCWEVIQIEQIRGQRGHFDKNLYIIDHYPPYVMMDRKEFEEKVWPDFKTLVDSKKRKTKKKNKDENISAENTSSSPCTENPDTVENDSRCTELPYTAGPCTVEPCTVKPDTNNNNLNNNSFNNNNLNNNNEDLDKESKDNVVVISSELKKPVTGDHQESGNPVTGDLITSVEVIRNLFTSSGIDNLPEGAIKTLQKYSRDEVSKIAVTLQKKREQGKVINPVGLLIARPEVIQAILKGEFLPDIPKTRYKPDMADKKLSFSEYELYVPLEVLDELKNKGVG